MRRSTKLVVRYEQELALFKTTGQKLGLALTVLLWIASPFVLEDNWLNYLNYAAVLAIGAIGLNLLTGFTGQVSLGHAFFIGCGSYVTAYLGVQQEQRMILWLPLAAVVGAVLGAVIGPFALRLRGQYLAIVTLGLLFIGQHVFENWDSVTGGGRGTPTAAPLDVGPLNFANLELFGSSYSRDQGIFWFFWFLVGVGALLAKNLVRSRPGRALQAVRDRDVAAEVIGVRLGKYKVGAFAISSAYAAVAGALYGTLQQFVSPVEFSGERGLFVSITYIAIIIVGGVATIFGSVIGAVVLGLLQRVIEQYSDFILLKPFTDWKLIHDQALFTVPIFNQVLYGTLIILFLVLEPRGLAAVWLRLKAYFKSWPFSY
jgi:branched-chain amino acid transport system permease protein